MKVEFADKIDPTVLAQPDGLLKALNLIFRTLTPGLHNGLSIGDNMNARIVTLGAVTVAGILQPALTSGVEYPIKNPLSTKKPLFTPMYATDANGNAVTISGWSLNTNRSDGRLGITVKQDPSGTYAEFQPTVDQSLGNGSNIPIKWGGTTFADPSSVISIANNGSGPSQTRILVSAPGLYQFSCNATFNPNSTGTRYVSTAKNQNGNYSGNERRGLQAMPAVAVDAISAVSVSEWPLVAGDYIEVFAFQDSGGSLILPGTVEYRSKVRVRRIDFLGNATASLNFAPTMIVTGVLWGG